MELTRQEDVSVYLYLRERIIAPQWAEFSEDYSLVQASAGVWDIEYEESLGMHPFTRAANSGYGRGLLYFDISDGLCIFGPEQTEMVQIFDGSTQVSGSIINYKKGQVYDSRDLSSCRVDYYWHYVATIDAWPDEDVPSLPIVSIQIQRADKAPLQLGGGDIREADWNIEIFGSSKGERDDILEILFDGLYQKRCSIYTFQNGLPLGRDGTFNTNFSLDYHANYTSLFFENVEKQITGLPRWGFYENERINKYRAQITFETKAYKK
jgi:hypothetical protein